MQLVCEQFRAEGYAVLPNFLEGRELRLLRQVRMLKGTYRGPPVTAKHASRQECYRNVTWLLSMHTSTYCNMAVWIKTGKPRTSKQFAHAAMLLPPLPAALQHFDCRGCIFETLQTKPSKLEATDQHAFAALRGHWPCAAAVCRMLFESKITSLVAALLHMGSSTPRHHISLFNDQV